MFVQTQSLQLSLDARHNGVTGAYSSRALWEPSIRGPHVLKALPEGKTEQPTLEQAQQVQAQGGGGAPLSESPTGAGQGPGEKGPGSGGTVVRKRAAWPLLPGGPWEPKAHGPLESRLPWDR